MPTFDIRQWRARKGLPERIDDQEDVKRVTELLRRDLGQRLAVQSQSSQDRTAHHREGYTERAESAKA